MVKTHAASELLAAVEAVSQGRGFVSTVLADYVPANPADKQAPKRLHSDKVLAPQADAEE